MEMTFKYLTQCLILQLVCLNDTVGIVISYNDIIVDDYIMMKTVINYYGIIIEDYTMTACYQGS